MLGQNAILEMFARSPLRPLQVHMQIAHASVQLLGDFCHALCQQHWQDAQGLYEDICDHEREADQVKCDMQLNLPKDLFLPVSRGDLLVLLTTQDTLANIAKDISGLMLGRKMRIPEALQSAFLDYVSRSIKASAQAAHAIDELDKLLESGFRGREVDLVKQMLVTLNQLEFETDQMQIALRRQLFAIEESLNPIDVMFLYKIFDWVGSVADKAQQAGYHLQVLLAG